MQSRTTRIAVWDTFIRLFHWSLLAAVVISFYTTKTSGQPFLFPLEVHAQSGYLIIGLLVFRVIWGLVGTPYARFGTFLYGPTVTARYTKALMTRRAPHYASHNPLGGWMVVLLLASLGFQALSGLFLSDDIFFQAPLYGLLGAGVGDLLGQLHALNSDLVLVLIGVHVLGLMWHALQGERLVTAMLTGVKKFDRPPADATSAASRAQTRYAIGALLIAAGVSGWLWFY